MFTIIVEVCYSVFRSGRDRNEIGSVPYEIIEQYAQTNQSVLVSYCTEEYFEALDFIIMP